jgi:hypothetical protein
MVIVEQEPGLAEASPMLFPAPQVRVICSQGLGKFGLGVLCMCLAGCGQNTSKRGSASHGDAGMIGDAGVPSMIDAAPATTGAGNADAAHPPSRPSSADA